MFPYSHHRLAEVKTDLNEVNLLNAKLLYSNKIFKSKNLNESQKVKVLSSSVMCEYTAFDIASANLDICPFASPKSPDPNALPTAPDGDLAYVLLNKEGKIQVEANEIYLGRALTLEQPYIRYTVYKATIEELQNQINALRDHIGVLS